MEDQLKQLQAIQATARTMGGRALLEQVSDAVCACMSALANTYGEASHERLISLCATLKANLELYETLTGVEDRTKALREIIEHQKQDE